MINATIERDNLLLPNIPHGLETMSRQLLSPSQFTCVPGLRSVRTFVHEFGFSVNVLEDLLIYGYVQSKHGYRAVFLYAGTRFLWLIRLDIGNFKHHCLCSRHNSNLFIKPFSVRFCVQPISTGQRVLRIPGKAITVPACCHHCSSDSDQGDRSVATLAR